MPTNIEWKARIRDAHKQRGMVERLTDAPAETLEQVDTFFRVPSGRLKLRQSNPGPAELIFYERPDQTAPKQSKYTRIVIDKPEELRRLLAQALGLLGVVQKTRRLYRVGQTRIHWDQVEGLGQFLEVEVVLRVDQSEDSGTRIAAELRDRLGVFEEELIAGAYLDLIGAKNANI